jgi:translocation and assembly module TamA
MKFDLRRFALCAVMMLFVVFAGAVTSGQDNSMVTINVQGVSGDALENVEAKLKTLQPLPQKQYSREDIDHFLRIIPKEVQEALTPFGYFRSKIKVQSIRNQGQWIINIMISPGQPVLIREINIKIQGPGSSNRAFEKFLKKIPLKSYQPLNIKEYNTIKQDLFDIALANGYFDATITKARISINLPQRLADISVIFQTGPSYFFGDTTFSSVPLQTRLLERFLPYNKGDPYRNSSIQALQQGLANSGYFQSVSVQPHLVQAEHYYVPVGVTLTTSKPRVYNLGIGYGTDTGPRALIGLNIRRLNERGHKLHLTLSGSSLKSALISTYVIPGKHPQTDEWLLSGGYGSENDSKGKSKALKFSGGYSWLWKGWQTTVSIIELSERYNLLNEPVTNTHATMPSIQLQRIYKDKLTNPSKGYVINFNTLGAWENFFSKTSFGQVSLSARGLYTFWQNYRFLLRGHMARTEIADLTNLPYSLQLYAGGAHSIRGYGYKQFSPGKNLVTASAELQRRLVKSLYIVAFYDVGNVSDNWLPLPFNIGIGTGFAWLSPIGTFELTIAKAISYGDGDHYRIQFAMGAFL